MRVSHTSCVARSLYRQAVADASCTRASCAAGPSSAVAAAPILRRQFATASTCQQTAEHSLASSSPAQTTPPPAAPVPSAPTSWAESLPFGYTKDNLPTRTDPTLSFFVGILMKDGKRAQANRIVMDVLSHLHDWTSAPPLPMFTEAINRASPLTRMQSSKSGGKITQIPIPLNPRQSNHRGIKAIIEASKKRNDRSVSIRLAREILAVLEGSSSVLARKEEQHKIAMANRANASVRI